MIRPLLLVTIFLWSIVSFAQKRSTYIKDQPLPARVVNDFGKFLTKSEKDYLEKELVAYRERSGYSVVIITLPSLTDNRGIEFTVEETAQLYFNKWGIGDNVKNDGVLMLLSRQPRRIRIHTGSGMATLLTDDNCSSIINNTMVPSFKADLYFTGLKDAIKEIETHIKDNEAANKAQAQVQAASTATPQALSGKTYSAGNPQEEMTLPKFMYGFITLVTLVWLFFRYRLKKAALGRSGVYSGGGYEGGDVVFNNVNRVSNNNWGGSGRRRSWFNSGGSSSGGSGWFGGSGGYSSGSSSSGSSSKGSGSTSGSASGSYGGGKSNGGGAGGSW